jgi:DNA-binding response OmpR family regulator
MSDDTNDRSDNTVLTRGERAMAGRSAGTSVNRRGFVLIRDDDALIHELLERWLRDAGYTVAPSTDEKPCLVITDLPNPRHAQALIRSLREVYAAPILLMSGRFRRGLAGSAETALRLGVKRVLPKPFTRNELLSAVAGSLDDEG